MKVRFRQSDICMLVYYLYILSEFVFMLIAFDIGIFDIIKLSDH